MHSLRFKWEKGHKNALLYLHVTQDKIGALSPQETWEQVLQFPFGLGGGLWEPQAPKAKGQEASES